MIKGLTFMPTGALVAAPTTSLPETPGGERNWDYRYSWIRDATFTLQALHFLNLDWEADEFMQFVADLEANEDGALQIMYAITARRDLTSPPGTTSPATRGPARCESATARSTSAKTTSTGRCWTRSCCTPTAHSACRDGCGRSSWRRLVRQCRLAYPTRGYGRLAGNPHYVSSKLDVLGRPRPRGEAGRDPGDPALKARWRATADEIHEDIVRHGIRDGVLRQHYETDALDASTLLAALFDFLPPDDERLRKSILAIADELTERRFVLRYRTDETDDGLAGKEGTFLICSFWLVSALAIIGEQQRAR